MTTLVFGLGSTGRSCLKYLNNERVVGCDKLIYSEQFRREVLTSEYSNLDIVDELDFLQHILVYLWTIILLRKLFLSVCR